MSDISRKLMFPQRLDDPPRFLWWDFDVAIIFMGCFLLGLLTEQMLVFVTCGFLGSSGMQKLKSGKHRAYGMHAVYWFLPVSLGFRVTPPSAVREFIG
jgi:conjugal transfer pilus assembly protein TraL